MNRDNRARLTAIVRDFCDYLHRNIAELEDGFANPDFLATDYSENYGCANAAVILAAAMHGDPSPRLRVDFERMLERAMRRAGGDEPNLFCRTFLVHYAMLAVLLLPEAEREPVAARCRGFFRDFRDDCRKINVNCAAMQYASCVFAAALESTPAPEAKLDEFLDFIAAARQPGGFINDSVSEINGVHDQMPIAYHGFILYLLYSAWLIGGRYRVLSDRQRDRLRPLLAGGLDFLRLAVRPDGGYAMCGRSRYQMFNWGVLTTLGAASGAADDWLARVIDSYRPYRTADGGYHCTPNWLPGSFRAGFEGYTRINMYNNLGLTGLAVASLLTDADRLPVAPLAPAADGVTVDEAAGYAFFRRGGTYFGVALRDHGGLYTPGMAGFHYRLGGEPTPLAECRIAGTAPLRESFAVLREGRVEWPALRDNAAAAALPDGVELRWADGRTAGVKRIRATERTLRLEWSVTVGEAVETLRATVPLLLHDGRCESRFLRRSATELLLRRQDTYWLLSASGDCRNLELAIQPSLDSVSGLASNLNCRIASADGGAVRRFDWVWELRRLDGAPPVRA